MSDTDQARLAERLRNWAGAAQDELQKIHDQMLTAFARRFHGKIRDWFARLFRSKPNG